MPQLALIFLFLVSNLQFVDRHDTFRHNMSNEVIIRQAEIQESHNNTKKVTVTFYCSCEICCGSWSGLDLTASGTTPVAGQTLAGDSRVLGEKCVFTKVPPGMEYLQYHADGTQKVFTFEDTGNPDFISGDRVDIFMGGPETHKLCEELGVKEMEIKILK